MDGRVQELPVQPRRRSVRERGSWRFDGAKGHPHQAELQVLQMVHEGGGLRSDEDLSAGGSAVLRHGRPAECGQSESVPGHVGQKEAQQDGHVRVCRQYKDSAANAVLGAELEARPSPTAKEGVPGRPDLGCQCARLAVGLPQSGWQPVLVLRLPPQAAQARHGGQKVPGAAALLPGGGGQQVRHRQSVPAVELRLVQQNGAGQLLAGPRPQPVTAALQ